MIDFLIELKQRFANFHNLKINNCFYNIDKNLKL